MNKKEVKTKKKNDYKKTFKTKFKYFKKVVKEELLFFIISILCFVFGLVSWILYKDNKVHKNRSIVCLYGSIFGVIFIFIIGFICGVMQFV